MALFFIICGELFILFAIIIMFFCEDDLIRFEHRVYRFLRGKIQKICRAIGKYDCKNKIRGKNDLTSDRMCGKIATQTKREVIRR